MEDFLCAFSFFFHKPPAVLLQGDRRLMGMQQGDRRPPAELRDFIVAGFLNLRIQGILNTTPAFQEIQNNTCVRVWKCTRSTLSRRGSLRVNSASFRVFGGLVKYMSHSDSGEVKLGTSRAETQNGIRQV